MLSSRDKLLFIKRMRLIGVAFYEPDIDRLDSIDIFGEMMATNKAVMQEDRVSDKLPALVILSGAAVNAKTLDQSSASAGATAVSGPGLTSITCPNICGRGYVPFKRISFIKRILSFSSPL